MSEQQGWIKLYRKFVDWEWYTDSATKDLFIHLLLTANHTEKKWRGETINKGELVTSIASLSAESGLSVKQVRTALAKLEKTGEISRRGANKYTLIIVVNYALYQGMEYSEGQTKGTQEDNQTANKGQTKGKQRATNKNDKNVKNDKNIKNIYGEFANVQLTDEEYSKLKADNLLPYIENLSVYIKSKGDKYKSHYATIRMWASRAKKNGKKLEVAPTYDLEQIKKQALENVEI